MDFLNDAARQAGTVVPARDESLFQSGLLDSFSLVDFITLVETECHIKVSDQELRPELFDTIEKVESFILNAAQAR